jgi:hypothetical protein
LLAYRCSSVSAYGIITARWQDTGNQCQSTTKHHSLLKIKIIWQQIFALKHTNGHPAYKCLSVACWLSCGGRGVGGRHTRLYSNTSEWLSIMLNKWPVVFF